MEAEIEQLQLEIRELKRENDKLREANDKLKHSLDELVRRTKPQPATRGLKPPSSQSQASVETADSSNDRELQLKLVIETFNRQMAEQTEALSNMKQSVDELVRRSPQDLKPPSSQSQASSETADSSSDSELQRKLDKAIHQLLVVQERLTINEQVTAATQRRELVQEHVYENLPEDSVYVNLRSEQTQEHVFRPTHRGVLRRQYRSLSTQLDAHVVAVHMYQRNALTLRDLQSIQYLIDRPVEAAETLSNIIMEQPDVVYLCFLDVLKHTEQQHIYRTLVEDGYQDYDDESSHTSVIRANYVYLLETLDVKLSGLVDQLYCDQVVRAEERDDINAEQTSFRANEKLLSVLSRKSPQQFQLFLDALDKCGQQHVHNVITRRQVGQVVLQTLPEGPPVCGVTSLVPQTLPEGPPVYGVTSLADEVFVLRGKGGSDQVEVYDAITYRSQRCLTVPNCLRFADVTSCEHYQCIYISEPDVECIHRLDSQGKAATQWPVNDKPFGLSVNTAHNLLVACRLVSKIKEFSTHGYLLREITLPDDVIKPWHAIQLTSGQFVVCHGNLGHPVHRVCMVSADGRQIVHSHGGQPGSSNDQCNGPMHLTVDENQFLFVADINNRRVKLLSPTLRYIRDVSSDLLKWLPNRLCLDTERSRLYIADCDLKDGKWTAGRVVVVSV